MLDVRRVGLTFGQRLPAGVAARIRSGSLSAKVLARATNRILPGGVTEVAIRSGPAAGLAILIEPQTQKYYWTGAHELDVQREVARVLRPGASFWDVGANIGFFAMLGARAVGRDGRVIAIEPIAENRERIAQAATSNGFANIEIVPCAVCATRGMADMHAQATGLEWSLATSDGGMSVRVRTRTLDDLADEFGPPDAIKIDAEGAELDVLRGGQTLLARHRPTLILEFHDDADLAEAEAVLEGFHLERVDDRHWLATESAR